eukprot:SM000171S03232  [mRNA]  locus=s171:164523:172250:+ [translate_table: standard]
MEVAGSAPPPLPVGPDDLRLLAGSGDDVALQFFALAESIIMEGRSPTRSLASAAKHLQALTVSSNKNVQGGTPVTLGQIGPKFAACLGSEGDGPQAKAGRLPYLNGKLKPVQVEDVELAISALRRLLLFATKEGLLPNQMADMLQRLGLTSASVHARFSEIVARIRPLISDSLASLPTYRRLDWRLDVQLASRRVWHQGGGGAAAAAAGRRPVALRRTSRRRRLITAIFTAAWLALLLTWSFSRGALLWWFGDGELDAGIQPMYPRLLESCIAANNSVQTPLDLWSNRAGDAWEPCVEPSWAYRSQALGSRGHLQVFLEGGLNQQRIGICNAVAVARLLNATLLLPELDTNPVWQDSSSFEDIFDVDHFIQTLKQDVRVVRELPEELRWSTRAHYQEGIRPTRVKNAPGHAQPVWYFENVLPLLDNYKIAAISPFAHRLTFDNLPLDIQQLRCRTNYEALRFVPALRSLGKALVHRMRTQRPPQSLSLSAVERSESLDASEVDLTQSRIAWEGGSRALGSIEEKFLALHLRFDKVFFDLLTIISCDMVAYSGCDYGGGRAEERALARYRDFLWQDRADRIQQSPVELRKSGKCPLTPEEVGLLLAALGFPNTTRLYLASHKVFGGEARMAPLRRLFPFMQDKWSLATAEELRPFERHSSLLAALDYYVCLRSNALVSASAGNMHNVLAGERAYRGGRKTIQPNTPLLARLLSNSSMQWPEFRKKIRGGHKNRLGQIRRRKPGQSIYAYPAPDCLCEQTAEDS